MTEQEQKRRLAEAEKAALKRNQPMANGGSIACEYVNCSCLIKDQITVTTMSVIVMPSLDQIQLVCRHGAEDFAARNGGTLNF